MGRILGMFYPVLQYIGPAENVAKHRYMVIIFNKERTKGLAVTRLVRS